MSEQTIKRWNGIPLQRPPDSSYLKRKRPEEELDDDDDDISLVSRSPSPARDAMDVDESGIHKYDEFVRRPVREVITVDTKIKPTNKGFALLTKLGWREGQPVGLNADGKFSPSSVLLSIPIQFPGLTEPIPFHIKSDMAGLGKANQDFQMIETTVSQRRELDSERQQRETEEQRKLREDSVVRKAVLEAELSSALKAFFCELCDKQFKNVTQYNEHTNSYAHHHKARFKDMQANSRILPQEDIDKRKEKERKREERDLRKMAAASGVKMTKSFNVPSAPTTTTTTTATVSMDIDRTPMEQPKTGGWVGISSGPSNLTSSTSGFKKSGWASIGSSSAPHPPSHPRPPSPPASLLADSNACFQHPPPPEHPPPPPPHPPPPPSTMQTHTPTFHAAGWASLDTGSSQPLPSPQPSEGRWNSLKTVTDRQSSFAAVLPTEAMPPPLPPPSSHSPAASIPPSSTSSASTQPVRSNWQQFQKGRRK